MLGGLFPFEAKAEVARVLLRPSSLPLHQTTDEARRSVAPSGVRCHRPTRAARLLEQAPAPEPAAGAAVRLPPARGRPAARLLAVRPPAPRRRVRRPRGRSPPL